MRVFRVGVTLDTLAAVHSFSQRIGLKAIKSVLQTDSMDDDLRNGLWNAAHFHFWPKPDFPFDLIEKASSKDQNNLKAFLMRLWVTHFKLPWDEQPDTWTGCLFAIRERYFSCDWNEVYDFVQFAADSYPDKWTCESFRDYCNGVLELEASGFRFVGDILVPITATEQMRAVELALEDTEFLPTVKKHLKRSAELFADRQAPDYRNSIKESISAVEALCRKISGSSATLGECLKSLDKKIQLHAALRDGFSKFYGWSSDDQGIRHGLMDVPTVGAEDAQLMLVSSSAFVSYLVAKAAKAELSLA